LSSLCDNVTHNNELKRCKHSQQAQKMQLLHYYIKYNANKNIEHGIESFSCWNVTSRGMKYEHITKKMNMPHSIVSIVLTKWKVSRCIATQKLESCLISSHQSWWMANIKNACSKTLSDTIYCIYVCLVLGTMLLLPKTYFNIEHQTWRFTFACKHYHWQKKIGAR